MDYDLLSQFDHPGVDPYAQQQAANLLSQPSQIQPPTFTGGGGLAEGRQEYISPQAPYVNPVNYASAGGYPSNNQIAMDAFAAARALQTANTYPVEMTWPPPAVEEPQRTVFNRNIAYGRFQPAYFEDGSRLFYPGVGAEVGGGPFGFANPNGSNLMPTNMAGNYVEPIEFQRQRELQSEHNMARALWRRRSQMLPLQGNYTGFNPTHPLDPSQVQDNRLWRR